MSAEILAYPFLFISIFFESFILLTFLSKPAREARGRVPGSYTPSVALIVPCFNEASTVAKTAESILALEYPKEKLSVILVNDGSVDGTKEAMAQFADYPQVTIIHKENGGKHTALNAGIAATRAEIVGCLDADSFVEPQALREILPSFHNPRVAASTAAMSVAGPSNLLQHMQNAEYIFGITLRHALASINGIYVTPGPFSLYRRDVVVALGGFRHGHQTEDLEMALRIQKAGYAIENAPRARVYTKAPRTVRALLKQRTRWTTGFLRNVFNEYRGLVWNRRFGALGMLVIPIGITTILSGIGLFFLAAYELIKHAVEAYSIRSGIPLTYTLMPHTFNWFYAPASLYLVLAVIAVSTALSLIAIGKQISNTPASLKTGILAYLLLYGFIAPLWLIRATADIAFGKTRAWR